MFDEQDTLNFAGVVIKSDKFNNKESTIVPCVNRINSQTV